MILVHPSQHNHNVVVTHVLHVLDAHGESALSGNRQDELPDVRWGRHLQREWKRGRKKEKDEEGRGLWRQEHRQDSMPGRASFVYTLPGRNAFSRAPTLMPSSGLLQPNQNHHHDDIRSPVDCVSPRLTRISTSSSLESSSSSYAGGGHLGLAPVGYRGAR